MVIVTHESYGSILVGTGKQDPCIKSCIDKMEMVQRRAARYVLHRYHNTSSVGKMLVTLQWTSLEERRKQQRLAMLYKLQHGQVAVNISDYSRHSHELAFQVPSTSVDYIKFSFFPRTARDWNLLPSDVIKAPSLTSFKSPTSKRGSDRGLRSSA